MLAHLQAKAGVNDVSAVVAEGSALPFPGRSFDGVIIARLLYLTADWRAILREADRALACAGCLLHEWGNGRSDEEWVQIREQARKLFEGAGLRAPFHPGVRSETEVDQELASLQFAPEGRLDLGPGPVLTIQEFLRRLVEGELSYIWNVPTDIRAQCLPRLRQWAENTFDLERPVPIPEMMYWTIYRRARPNKA
jgi:SAM-dependent methyltransferase